MFSEVQEANGIGAEKMVFFTRPGRRAGSQGGRGCLMCGESTAPSPGLGLLTAGGCIPCSLMSIPSVGLLLPGVAMSLRPRTLSLTTWRSKFLEEPSWSLGGTAASEKRPPWRSPSEVSSLSRVCAGPQGQPAASPHWGEGPMSHTGQEGPSRHRQAPWTGTPC